MIFAEGMEEEIRIAESFASDAEAAAYWSHAAPDVATEDVSIPGAGGQSQIVRLYRGDPNAPTLLYIHGGGWVGGSIPLNEASARSLCQESGWTVAAVSYRLAPTHPYPAALSDCIAIWGRLVRRLERLGGGPIAAVGGVSAGANLALSSALSFTQHPPLGLLLFYGVFGDDFDTESYKNYAEGYGLSPARMQQLFSAYDPNDRRKDDPLIVPLKADLSRLPPVCLIAAEFDVLREDSERLHDRLSKAGVPSTLHIEPGVTHGFINRGRLVPAAGRCLKRAAHFLKSIQDHKGQ